MDDITTEQESAASSTNDDSEKITCHSISEGSFESKFWRAHTDKEWTLKGSQDDDKNEDDVSGVSLKNNVRLVLSPILNRGRGPRNRNRLSDTDMTRFHKELKTDDMDGMVVMFQAKAEQFISVALSPWPSIEEAPAEQTEVTGSSDAPEATPVLATAASSSTSYEVVFGANNNTSTIIRKLTRGAAAKKSKVNAFAKIPSRVCRGFGGNVDTKVDNGDNDDASACWTSYWVCLSNSRLYVGMGKVPGKECFGVLEDESQEQQEQPNEGKEKDEASATTETTVSTEAKPGTVEQVPPIRYVGIGNNTTGQKNKDSAIEVQNLVVTNVPPCLESLLNSIPSQDDLPIVCLAPAAASSSGMDIDEDAETLELKKYMEDYKAECLIRKKRAMKYGTNYKEQPMKDFLPWTMAKRLQGKHRVDAISSATKRDASGFVAGDIDFLDPKEISKREARLARFAAKTSVDGEEKSDQAEDETGSKAISTFQSTDGLPVEQAWDKENMLRKIRRDPPPYLWKESPSNSDTLETTRKPDPFSMYDESTKAATWIPDKLHISSIDWAAFKQIRNDDLIKHLEAYGPIKYIEWLGDVSCNVCFANKVSASRALVCLSNELPSPPPLPPTGATDAKKEEVPETKAEGEESKKLSIASAPPKIDLGCMTWRFGKRAIRKVSNDRYGRRGTIARYLLRVATTEDVLIERPNSWPKPPGGFASDRVLGPKSDYASSKNKAKKKQNNQQQQQQTIKKSNSQQQQQNRRGSNSKRKRGRGENNGHHKNNKQGRNERQRKNNKPSEPLDLLNRGLSSSRGGFSVEEMEKERQAKKKQKTS